LSRPSDSVTRKRFSVRLSNLQWQQIDVTGSNNKLHLSRPHRKGSPYSIAEHRVPELIPVLGSQPAGDVIHKPGGRLPLLSARLAVTLGTLKRAAINFTD